MKLELLIKYMDLLLFVSNGEKCISDIYRYSKNTFTTVENIANIWTELGIVEKRRQGRKVFLKLTEKGKRVLEIVNELNKLLEVNK